MACFYGSDFDAVGGFGESPQTNYFGWGREDADLVRRWRKNARYSMFRSHEPDLFHVWHRKDCDRNKKYAVCRLMDENQSKKTMRPVK